MSSTTELDHLISTDDHICNDCGVAFSLARETQALFPGWVPQRCLGCHARLRQPKPGPDPSDVLRMYTAGPDTGIFVSGACDPNPGRGGWCVVRVVGGAVLNELTGAEPATTNIRMELTALIEGLSLALPAERVTVSTDDLYCVNTLVDWAPQWQRNGWRRGAKREPVANLDLVMKALEVYESRPNATVRWVKAGARFRWNEYASALSRSSLAVAA